MWITKYLFLGDFFIRLNQLNISKQRIDKILLDMTKTLSRFKGKIQLWVYRIESGKIAAFLASNAFADEVEIDLRCIRQICLENLTASLRPG